MLKYKVAWPWYLKARVVPWVVCIGKYTGVHDSYFLAIPAFDWTQHTETSWLEVQEERRANFKKALNG